MRPHGFPPALRIRRKADFDAVFRRGSRASDERMAVHAKPNDLGHPRLGLAVSRGAGGAVVRNKVKRRLREIFRLHRDELPAGHDLVVVVKTPAAADCSYSVLEASFLDTARRAAERLRRAAERRGRD
ncbi:MAG: ribonuclease P protein component [Planctomycetota bacterium]